MQRLRSFRLPVWAQDTALALFVTVMQVQGVLVRGSEPWERDPTELGNLGIGLLVGTGLSLLVRRRWPVGVFLVNALASIVYFSLDFSDGPGWLALFVAIYTCTAYGDGQRSVKIASTGIVVLTVAWLLAARDVEPPAAIGWVFFRIGASVMSAALGESVRARRVIAAEAVARAELAERTRDEEARARVDSERLRIAREVHDTVAHAIAIINVQAGVTAHVLDRRPDQARDALEAIEQTSSRALHELRSILGVLRDEHGARSPHPGLDQLDDLTARAREAGLEVDVETSPRVKPLPSAVDSAAYGVLQESITNVIRHVGPTRVMISVQHGPDELAIRVADNGSGEAPSPHRVTDDVAPGAGRGILGMQERCRLLGGEATASRRPEGGFEVLARLPLTPVGTGR